MRVCGYVDSARAREIAEGADLSRGDCKIVHARRRHHILQNVSFHPLMLVKVDAGIPRAMQKSQQNQHSAAGEKRAARPTVVFRKRGLGKFSRPQIISKSTCRCDQNDYQQGSGRIGEDARQSDNSEWAVREPYVMDQKDANRQQGATNDVPRKKAS